MQNTLPSISMSLLVLALLAGCGSQPFSEQSGAVVEDRNPEGVSTSAVQKVTVADRSNSVDPRLKDPSSPLSKRSIYFDLDSHIVKDEYKTLLNHHARFLAENGKYKMLIQGNADERGSREYNLALGQRRSEALRKALMLLGTQEAQIESVSLGEERPACMEQTESCWAQNRRGDMLYSGEF